MNINFSKFSNGLVPAVIQDSMTKNVLMLGYMNEAAYQETLASKKVTFFSRSKQRLWVKGEESGNTLDLVSISIDCDSDALLIQAEPNGPVCHEGFDTCWKEKNTSNFGFLTFLENVIQDRKDNKDQVNSYTALLFRKGINKIAQKLGEEAVEVVIESKDDDDLAFLNESADLMFHFLVLLQAKGFRLQNVEKTLSSRHKYDRDVT